MPVYFPTGRHVTDEQHKLASFLSKLTYQTATLVVKVSGADLCLEGNTFEPEGRKE